jgi:hypothetical protein
MECTHQVDATWNLTPFCCKILGCFVCCHHDSQSPMVRPNASARCDAVALPAMKDAALKQ